MKLIVLIFFFLCLKGFGQFWIDSGAVWRYDNTQIFGYHHENTYRYTKDTLIDGQLCQKIEHSYQQFLINSIDEYEYLGSGISQYFYTYTSGDTIFYRKNDTFYVYLNFAASIGDQWILSIDSSYYGCNDTSLVEVVGVGSYEMNGYNYRTVTLETIPNSFYALDGVYNEKFGSFSIGLQPSQKVCDSSIIVETYVEDFKTCFEDNSFPLYSLGGSECGVYTNLSTDDVSTSEIRVYPNPFQDFINFSNKFSGEVMIYSIMGQPIFQDKLYNASSLDLSVLSQGLYLIIFIHENGILEKYTLIKE